MFAAWGRRGAVVGSVAAFALLGELLVAVPAVAAEPVPDYGSVPAISSDAVDPAVPTMPTGDLEPSLGGDLDLAPEGKDTDKLTNPSPAPVTPSVPVAIVKLYCTAGLDASLSGSVLGPVCSVGVSPVITVPSTGRAFPRSGVGAGVFVLNENVAELR